MTKNALPPVKSKTLPPWAGLVVFPLLALICIGVFLIVSAQRSALTPKKLSDQFIAYLQSGETEAAYTLTSSGFSERTSVPALNVFGAAFREVIPAPPRHTDTKESALETYVGYKSTGTDGINYSIAVTVIEENESLRIKVFDIVPSEK